MERVRKFHAEHPLQRAMIARQEWEYIGSCS